MIALRTTHVTPRRRAAAMAALSWSWRPGDAVVIRWFTPPAAGENDDLVESCESVANAAGAEAFIVGFCLWLDARLDAAAIGHAVPLALSKARRLIK